MIKLSILIPTTPDRQYKLSLLISSLQKQIEGKSVEVLVNETKSYKDQPTLQHTIGYKRNKLVNLAKGQYCSFVDSDDEITDNYIDLILNALNSNKHATHCSLFGIYYEEDKMSGVFQHSNKYKKWRTTNNKIKYERSVNHLNTVKTEIMLKCPFPQIMWGQDHAQSKAMQKYCIEEARIEQILYLYKYEKK